jgi:hypothetical protein
MGMSFLSLFYFVFAGLLLVTPGGLAAIAPIGCRLPGGLGIVTAIVLSPLVLSLELAVASLCGMPFDTFVFSILPLNLVGFIPLVVGWNGRGMSQGELAATVCSSLLILPIAFLLITVPHEREYGWHNMFQIAAIDQIYQLPRIPENLDLAGFRLNYPWLGFAQLAIICRLTDLPPTILFPVMNLVQFVALFVFLAAAARRLGASGPWLCALATAALLLSPGMLDIAGTIVTPSRPFHGELKITPMTSKYLVIDSMVLGLSAFAMLVYAAVGVLTEVNRKALRLISPACLACGVGYPLLFPACIVVVSFAGLALLARTLGFARLAAVRWLPRYELRSIISVGVGFVVVCAIFEAYLLTLGASTTRTPVDLAVRAQIRRHVEQIFVVFGPLILGLLLLARSRWRLEDGRQLLLATIFGALMVAFLLLTMPTGVEYKFLFAGLLVITPVLAAALTQIPLATAGRFAIIVALLVFTEATSGWALWRWQIPRQWLPDGAALDESSRFLHPLRGWHGSWMEAVSDQTPIDTVVLTADTTLPLPVFLNRTFYVAVDSRSNEGQTGRVGYSMNLDTLIEEQNYSRAELTRRLDILRNSLSPAVSKHELAICLETLSYLRRPIAVHFTGPTTLAELLRQKRLGRQIFQSGSDSVWLIGQDELQTFVESERVSGAGATASPSRPAG